jgi:hypothetical protein
VNETGEWIFSDDAHEWMDRIRRKPDNYRQSAHGSTGAPRPGWEYGLFGFKDNLGGIMVYRGVDEAVTDHQVRTYHPIGIGRN